MSVEIGGAESSEMSPRPEGLRPGDVVSFADMREFVEFEDMLMPYVDRFANVMLWQSRPKIGDLLRPQRYNGTIKDISLLVMEEPYERFLDAKDRGWEFSLRGGFVTERVLNEVQQYNDQYLGFVFEAEAASSNPGLGGRITTELWYYPLPRDRRGTNKSVNLGQAIRRVVAKPQYDKQRFEAAHDRSRAVGFAVLADAMRNAISTPMRD